MRSAGILLAALLLSGGHASADVLDGAFHAGTRDGGDIYQIAFGRDLVYMADERLANGTLVVRLREGGEAAGAEFEQKTLRFTAGELGPIRVMALSGSPQGGYVLAVTMGRVDDVAVIPQADFRRLAIRVRMPAGASAAAGSRDGLARAALPAAVPVGGGSPASPASAASAATAGIARAPTSHADALAEGREAAGRADYALAVAAFTRAAGSSEPAVRQEALELLGVAREYNGQKAHAKAAWEQYLREFPEAPEAPRVKQRLIGLVTRDLPVRARLEDEDQPRAWRTSGSLSQFYRRHTLTLEGGDDVVGIDALFTDADLIADRKGEMIDLGVRFSGSNAYDMTGEQDDDRAFLVSAAYVELEALPMETRLRIGRQSRTSTGVLGRFDGATLDWSPMEWLTLGTVFGYALDSAFDGFHDDRPFYGLSGEVSLLDGRVELAPFVIEQEADGFTDRRAVGLESRFYSERFTAFSLLDYDIYHEALNNAYVYANARLDGELRLYASLDRRSSPYITTQNALIGVPFEDLSDLEQEYALGEILELANDRTAEMDLATVGFDKGFGGRHEIGADVAYSDYSATEVTEGLTAAPAQRDLYYTLRYRVEEPFGPQSHFSTQLRYADGDDSTGTAVYLSGRIGVPGGWRVYPRLLLDRREYEVSDQEQTRVAPSLRLDYRFGRHVTFELEGGYDWTTRTMPADDFDSEGFFFRLGYRSFF